MKVIAIPLAILIVMSLALIPATTAAAADEDNLTGSSWALTSYGTPDAETPVMAGTTITLAFLEGSRVAGSGGCNRYTSSYAVEGEAITFSRVLSTRRFCEAEGVMDQERAYFDALETASRFELSGSQLTIEYGDGGRLIFIHADVLGGSQWRLVSYGAPGAETPVIAGSAVTLVFSGAEGAGGTGGCNVFGGSYAVDEDTISFSEIFSTQRFCMESGVMDQERAYFEALESAVRFELFGDQLIIVYGDGQQLVFSRTTPLSGTAWQLMSYGAPGAEMSIVPGSTVTLVFSEQDRLGGSGGCNTFGGSYTIEGDSITIGQVFSTLMACLDNAVMRQEQAYFDALRSAARFELSGDQLSITYGDGQQLLFIRAPGESR